MIATTEHLQDMWAAMEQEMTTETGQTGSEWLVSLRIVMSAVERALLGAEGRGAYIFVLTPRHGEHHPPPIEGGEGAPQPEGSATPPAG